MKNRNQKHQNITYIKNKQTNKHSNNTFLTHTNNKQHIYTKYINKLKLFNIFALIIYVMIMIMMMMIMATHTKKKKNCIVTENMFIAVYSNICIYSCTQILIVI